MGDKDQFVTQEIKEGGVSLYSMNTKTLDFVIIKKKEIVES